MSGNDLARRKGLRRMRLIATSLLVVAAIVFVLTHGQDGWISYVNAAAEAAMVGAIADWFAVTALFRHPLGLPIPHTAIIPKRKASLGESLQEFVADNFLRDDIVRERVLSAGVAKQAGAWVLEGEHAQRLVEEGSRIMSDGLSRIRRTDVAAVVQEALVPRMAEEPLAPVAGQLLGEIVEDRAHSGLVDLMTDELLRWLGRNGSDVLAIVEERAPWWTPQWLDEKVADRIYREAVRWVRDIHEDVNHPARLALDSWLADLAVALQEDAETQERFERLKVRLLEQPQLSSTSIALWDAFRRSLIGALADPDGLLRRRALDELLTLAHRLQDDEALARRIDTVLADVAGYAVSHYGHQVATIISATVDRWDGKETADRVELHVGRDLQFIRINGTVVGGLAGLVIHTLAELL
ncbi:hypothetical protein ASD11_07080 [Aeromicrobium sp. Root495]|nr:hypothetical protein ASD11_07080 [Aeromicrobium sp. Root495]